MHKPENITEMTTLSGKDLSFEDFKKEVLSDYKIGHVSRQMSTIGRKEVLTGKAKFGIFGDGKEVAQIALAKQFAEGDWRSGYYRDQTFLLAAGMTTPKIFFAMLYGETRTEFNPDNSGRSFNNHFGSRLINDDGTWKDQSSVKNTASDISPTAGQMPRLVGLALASKLYRNNPDLKQYKKFSKGGNEVAFGTIGDASTSEGHFFETMNAAGVLQIPLAISIWDDGYGISVPTRLQTINSSISKALKGFEKGCDNENGILIYNCKGWDYPALCQMYEEGISKCRKHHIPVLFHVDELTQPMGHSTSGSHERYKPESRMHYEKDFDCLLRMRDWIEQIKLATSAELDAIEDEAYAEVKKAQKEAYSEWIQPLEAERDQLISMVTAKNCVCNIARQNMIDDAINQLRGAMILNRKEILSAARKVLRNVCSSCELPGGLKSDLKKWVHDYFEMGTEKYNKYLYDESSHSALVVKPVAPVFNESSPAVHGREILRDNFDFLLANDPRLVIFGEDTGNLGGVNQTLEGMQKKYGDLRVFDTGIREATIVGKAIGLALRGLRPIAEIQYFDYILYALQTLSDDVASLHYRTKAGQKVPLIISTRGHRLEGIWHSGSPLGMVVNAIRGIYVCVPRDMTRAAGFYNTLLQGEDPALVIEPLNGYRLREMKPENPGQYRLPLGVPEVLREGTDVTLVTYGSCVRIGLEAVEQLAQIGISVELIDVQTLLPFDIHHKILESVKKTSRIVFFDEDVPGGATAFMMQKVLEEQGAYFHLDARPVTVTAREHRPAYGTDGDYFSNPNTEDVFEAIYALMSDSAPQKFLPIYS
jgi:pyruvate/2-oxoglutarate/acetoin dehydrogenase E1 component/TPP-dependent pyruvate/acetoin dehydrogenase alpha subunit